MDGPFIVINPGTGPVKGATETRAMRNVRHFLVDLDVEDVQAVRLPERDREGRFGFLLWRKGYPVGRCVEIDMPGCPLKYIHHAHGDRPDDILWRPRLYVGGNSWYWPFAVDVAREDLGDADEGEVEE